MHIVHVGRRFYNLEYLIMAEATEDVDGRALLVTMETGREIRLVGEEADDFVSCLERVLAPRRDRSGAGSVGVDLDPRTGEPLPRTPGRKRKVDG